MVVMVVALLLLLEFEESELDGLCRPFCMNVGKERESCREVINPFPKEAGSHRVIPYIATRRDTMISCVMEKGENFSWNLNINPLTIAVLYKPDGTWQGLPKYS